MAEKLREVAEIPQQFVKEGTLVCIFYCAVEEKLMQQFVNRCTKPSKDGQCLVSRDILGAPEGTGRKQDRIGADSVEYLQLCRAIAVGFVVMGFIGYLVKLIHIPM
jgi:protein transport protein SEC61 subunit gamma-like protein